MYKSSLLIHLIFVCKYRKKLLNYFKNDVKSIFKTVSKQMNFEIQTMEADQDHIHLLISYPPTLSVTSIVRRLKQQTSWELWQNYESILTKHFWKKRTFWSSGYFVCSIGNASKETIEKYIDNQG